MKSLNFLTQTLGKPAPLETPPPPDSAPVTAEFVGKTVLAWLRSHAPERSWSQCRQVLASRRVKINGVVSVDEGRRLKPGDRVELSAGSAPMPDPHKLTIYHLDADCVVLEKPPYIVSTRRPEELHWPLSRRLSDPTVDELAALAILQRETPQIVNKRGWRPTSLPRLWRVQRLDRLTSGLLVFARHEAAGQRLSTQFAEHSVEREYRAIVHGVPPLGTIATSLVRDRGDGLRGSAKSGQRAVTHVESVEPVGDFSIIRCRLETGRTHQIRIHLAELGHPICGENVYGSKPGGQRVTDGSGVPRLALHATRLAFRHPVTQMRLEFESDWPEDLSTWLQQVSR